MINYRKGRKVFSLPQRRKVCIEKEFSFAASSTEPSPLERAG